MPVTIYITPQGRDAFDLRTTRIAATLEAHDVSLVPALTRRIPDDMPPVSMPVIPQYVGRV